MKEMEMREEIEWLNYWIETAYAKDKKRILILGDSVARGYRPILNRMLRKDDCAVDLIAMSYSLFDPSLKEEITHFVDTIGYQYNHIIFNLGAHHGYMFECKSDKGLQETYYREMKKILGILGRMSRNIITVSGTPENVNRKEANNDEIEIRNVILKKVSRELGYKYIDLYSSLYNNKQFPQTDIVHFFENGYEYIAYELSKALGFENMFIRSNRVTSLKKFMEIIEKAGKVYIYGDGQRGRKLRGYLMSLNAKLAEGYIVSNEFYRKGNSEQVPLEEIADNFVTDDVFFVTPEDIMLWEALNKLGMNYYTLDAKLYSFIDEYMDVYI